MKVQYLSCKFSYMLTSTKSACVLYYTSLFETLPAKNTEFLEAWKVHNDALLLYACVHGGVESVAAIIALNSSAQIRRFLFTAQLFWTVTLIQSKQRVQVFHLLTMVYKLVSKAPSHLKCTNILQCTCINKIALFTAFTYFLAIK